MNIRHTWTFCGHLDVLYNCDQTGIYVSLVTCFRLRWGGGLPLFFRLRFLGVHGVCTEGDEESRLLAERASATCVILFPTDIFVSDRREFFRRVYSLVLHLGKKKAI